MRYEKPEVILFGNASQLVQALKQDVKGNEGARNEIGSVYDTEE